MKLNIPLQFQIRMGYLRIVLICNRKYKVSKQRKLQLFEYLQPAFAYNNAATLDEDCI